MKFSDWLKLDEIGTGTSSVAVFARPVFSGPLRTRSWPWEDKKEDKKKKESFSAWAKKKLTENVPITATDSPTQTFPQSDQPMLHTQINMKPKTVVQTTPAIPQISASLNPANYQGANRSIYNKLYSKFVSTKDNMLGQTLQKAIQGDETDLIKAAQNP